MALSKEAREAIDAIDWRDCQVKLKEAEAENDRLREALAFYADEGNYAWHTDEADSSITIIGQSNVQEDRGERARRARGESE